MEKSQTWHQYPIIKQELQAVNHQLHEQIHAANPRLQSALLSMADNGGKYLRPAMVLLIAKTVQPHHHLSDQLIQIATSIEVLHMASLIHDDIIDDSPTRRGQLSIQSRFGKDTAVYAGDYLFTVFFELLVQNITDDHYLQVNAHIMQRLLNGELGQMALRFDTQESLHQYLRNINGKTAALFELAAREGAYFSGGNHSAVVHAAKFGQNIGIAFQMLDDILDYTGTSQLTKPVLEDLGTGVYSLPLLMALQNPGCAARLRPLLNKRYNLTMQDAKLIQKVVVTSDALDKSRQLAARFTNCALDHLRMLPSCRARQTLEQLAHQLLQRTS
ncbi:polyprenyl synthetase family protein [Limosilactobacillus caecicola]|uniref:polyprenyl synthetase family protein n=1 Tax=Limosilactobacillus caecicola TaxID=2941332 RepID=UPI00203EBFBB|nr:polyprenyl synthetase family protein [Limosilactobacillus caecicola]